MNTPPQWYTHFVCLSVGEIKRDRDTDRDMERQRSSWKKSAGNIIDR